MLSCYVIETLHHLQSNHDHLMSAKNKETISQSSILRCGYFIPLYISRLSPTTIAGLYLWDFLWLPYCKSVSEGFGSDWSNLKKLSFCFHFLKIFSLVWNATLIFFSHGFDVVASASSHRWHSFWWQFCRVPCLCPSIQCIWCLLACFLFFSYFVQFDLRLPLKSCLCFSFLEFIKLLEFICL